MLEKFERIKFGHFPTPIEHLKNITKYLGGPNIFIKRDDCTGLATGGNKTRKLEFLIPDAIKIFSTCKQASLCSRTSCCMYNLSKIIFIIFFYYFI